MGIRRDFVVESKGHCFLCLDEISDLPSTATNPDPETQTFFSLESLSAHLGMDLRKVFHQGAENLIPPHLIETIKNSKLKGELCEQCAFLNANFVTLYQNLERIKMEMLASLNQISMRLLKTKETAKLAGLKSLSESTDNSEASLKDKLEILKVLRTEAREKCSLRLSAALPRVRVKNLSKGEIEKVIKNYTVTSSSDGGNLGSSSIKSDLLPGTIITLKMENSDETDPRPSDKDDNHYPDRDSDSFGSNSTSDTDKSPKREKRESVNRIQDIQIPQTRLNPDTGKYNCGICVREFMTVSYYKEHYRTKHLKIKYKYTICEKEFNNFSGYRTHHLLTHVGESFTCRLCGRSFTQKTNLQRHERLSSCRPGSGSKTKKHICKCQQCGKGFTRKDHLKVHFEEVHSNSREHACDLCGMKFKRRRSVLRHQTNVDCRPK